MVNIRSNSLVVKGLDSNTGVPCSKQLGGSKVDLAVHPSEVDKIRTRNFWEIRVVKTKLPPRSGSSLEAVELHP